MAESKDSLVECGPLIIPVLLPHLRDTGFVKLTNTGDLIYPGSASKDGHGIFLDYNIDWVSIRIGWVIEEITGQDFGFKNSTNLEHEIAEIVHSTYREIFQDSAMKPLNITQVHRPKLRPVYYRDNLANVVEHWWRTAGKSALTPDRCDSTSE